MQPRRREFLRSSLAASTLVSMGSGTVPGFLGRSAWAAEGAPSNDRVLVVVQLLGGNDGLNTVIPFADEGYTRHRRALRIPAGQVQKLDKAVGLHPALGGMSKLAEDGRLTVVQGVGYPNPDRSHFRSMEIWESARLDPKALDTGWLGRSLDARTRKPGDDVPGIHVGSRVLPLALKSKQTEVPSVVSLEQYRLQLAGSDAERRSARTTLDQLNQIHRAAEQDDPVLGFIRRSTLTAYESSRRLEEITKKSSNAASSYPTQGLAQRLALIAQVIKAGFGTRIFYTSLDGFDTHANQLGTHAALLTELSDAIAAFHKDLTEAKQADRVALLVFSEFGRRVGENASFGTDHGAAAPVFVVGPVAKAGPLGAHPSLSDLDDGDLKHHTDFRRVYADLIGPWLGLPVEPVLGPGFAPLGLFRV
ncbi:MAG: DUF1501 domain-containing protein [Isosphaeraceae bacterium]